VQVEVCTIFTRYKVLQNVRWYAALVVSVPGESAVMRHVVVREYDNGWRHQRFVVDRRSLQRAPRRTISLPACAPFYSSPCDRSVVNRQKAYRYHKPFYRFRGDFNCSLFEKSTDRQKNGYCSAVVAIVRHTMYEK